MTKMQKIALGAMAVLFVSGQNEAYSRVNRRELYHILVRDKISTSLSADTKITSIGKMLLEDKW